MSDALLPALPESVYRVRAFAFSCGSPYTSPGTVLAPTVLKKISPLVGHLHEQHALARGPCRPPP